MVGSVAVVLTVFGQVSALDSLESRRTLEEALSRPPADALGIGIEGAQTALRVMATVSAACATAAAILGYQVLQRSRSARVALSVLALPLFVTGIASGGILSSVVVAASLILWAQPARDWFNGVAAAPASEAARRGERGRQDKVDGRDAARREAQREAFRTPPTGTGTGTGPPPPPPAQPTPPPADAGPAQPPPAQPQPQPQPGAAHPAGPPAYAATYAASAPTVPGHPPTSAPAGPRPAVVTWACVLTWVFTALAAGLMTMVALALVAVPDLYDEVTQQTPELAQQGVSEGQVIATAVVTAVVVVLWSALAAFFAVQTWRRRSWARTGLLASAAAAGLLSLTGVLASVVLVVPLAACVAVVALLLRTEVRWWLR